MIQINEHGYLLKGSKSDIRAEMAKAFEKLMEQHIFTEDELHELIHLAALPEEAIKQQLEEELQKLAQEVTNMKPEFLKEIIDEILGGK